jgi:dephospho-CoA kinase
MTQGKPGMIVIGAVGRNGAGKDTLIDYVCRRCSVHKVSVGDIVRDIARKNGMELTRQNLHQVAQTYMSRYGQGVFMRRVIEIVDAEGWEAVGIAGVRAPNDVAVLRRRYGPGLVLVHVKVENPLVRYERVRERDRPRDPDALKEFRLQERMEEQEFHISEAIKEADVVIDNDGSLTAFYDRIERFLIEPVVAAKVPCRG